MIAASSVETEGNNKPPPLPPPQVLSKLSSKYFAYTVMNSKWGEKKQKERKSVQIHFKV